LPAGTYFAHVESESTLSDQAYQLQLILSATCGDGVQEGAETCDDGGTTDGDGCAATCDLEFDLAGRGGCSTAPEQSAPASLAGLFAFLALALYTRRRLR
jgi:MYXO-CTERM domain-containing protein